MSTLLLAIDTTGERCGVAVASFPEGRVLASREPSIGKGHAERLMDLVDEVLGDVNASYVDLSRIAVAVGPGSFTGIRVGVSAARGLALALSIPAVGVDALAALAQPHLGQGVPVLAVQDARRGEVHLSLTAGDGDLLLPPQAVARVALGRSLAGHGDPLLCVGSGSDIAREVRPGLTVLDASGLPALASIARLGAREVEPSPPRPLYLRAADAKPQARAGLLAAAPVPLQPSS